MAAINKSSLNNIVRSVLSVGNHEQNLHWPPYIITDQFNTVTSLLLSELVKLYPFSQDHHDMLEPFIKFKPIGVKDGFVNLEDDFRNLLGSPGVNVRQDGKQCGEAIIIDTESEFKTATLKLKCETRPLMIVPKSEWDIRTTSEYKAPTYRDPIGMFIGSGKIQVCPYDIGTVYVLYARKEKLVEYGYIMQPDDTYLYDLSTSEESEWNSAAFDPLFKSMLMLYSAYTRNKQLGGWANILKQGIL